MGLRDDSASGQHDGVRAVDLDQRLKKVANGMFEIGLENSPKVGGMGKAGRRDTHHRLRDKQHRTTDIDAASRLRILEETQPVRKLRTRACESSRAS